MSYVFGRRRDLVFWVFRDGKFFGVYYYLEYWFVKGSIYYLEGMKNNLVEFGKKKCVKKCKGLLLMVFYCYG